jgi:IS5 family transposase
LVTEQLHARAVTVKTGTLVDATVVASASRADAEAAWSGHRSRKAIHGYKAHVAADADTGLVERLDVTPGNVVKAERNLPRSAEVKFPSWRFPVISRGGDRGSCFSGVGRGASAVAAG